jgi:hypothetical protein
VRMLTRIVSSVVALSACAFSTEVAHAQSHAAVSSMAEAQGGASALTPPDPSAQLNDDEKEAHEHPMSWAGIGVKVGLASIATGKGNIYGQQGRIDSRMGAHVAVPINLGGEGASFTLEPYFSRSDVSHDVKDTAGVVTGTSSVGLSAYGVYLGPTFNIHVARPLYLGFGFGVKGAYLQNNAFDYAFDAYARVPLHGTYYVNNSLAFVAEVGLGYGASVFVDKPTIVVDPVTRSVRNTRDDPQFGTAFTWDASFGVRLP